MLIRILSDFNVPPMDCISIIIGILEDDFPLPLNSLTSKTDYILYFRFSNSRL